MSTLQRFIRVQVMVTDDELKAIEDWRFAHHLPSRAAALREIMRLGMMTSDQQDTVQ